MADEELHETTADNQNDLQSTDDTAAVEEGNETVQMPLRRPPSNPLPLIPMTMTISTFRWTASKRY